MAGRRAARERVGRARTALPAGVAALAACFLAAGIAIGCVETGEHAAVAALAPPDLRGSAFGLLAGYWRYLLMPSLPW
jgi:hypothetical protein